jgi:hypothetical protein
MDIKPPHPLAQAAPAEQAVGPTSGPGPAYRGTRIEEGDEGDVHEHGPDRRCRAVTEPALGGAVVIGARGEEGQVTTWRRL